MTVEESMDYLRNTAVSYLQAPYRELCLEAMQDYATGYGGAKHHHAYKGGLAVHVADVVRRCLMLANPETTDMAVLLTAAYWHDYEKLSEYREVKPSETTVEGKLIPAIVGYTDYIKIIGHPVGSTYAFIAAVVGLHLREHCPMEKQNAIVHCMLSHHGRKEWGSPVEPATQEAWLLHAADIMSSRADA